MMVLWELPCEVSFHTDSQRPYPLFPGQPHHKCVTHVMNLNQLWVVLSLTIVNMAAFPPQFSLVADNSALMIFPSLRMM